MTPCAYAIHIFQRDPMSGHHGTLQRSWITVDHDAACDWIREHEDPSDTSKTYLMEPVWTRADYERRKQSYARRYELTLD